MNPYSNKSLNLGRFQLREKRTKEILKGDKAVSILVKLLEVGNWTCLAIIMRITFVHSFEMTRFFKYFTNNLD